MSTFDLTSLAALKAWLGLPSASGPNDATLAALITAASRSIYAHLSRPALTPQIYTETIDLETQRIFLRQWPVLDVNWVTWRGISIPASQSPSLDASIGYALQPAETAPPGASPGDRSLGRLLSRWSPKPRRLVSCRLCRAGRNADRFRLHPISSPPPRRTDRGRPISELRTPRMAPRLFRSRPRRRPDNMR